MAVAVGAGAQIRSAGAVTPRSPSSSAYNALSSGRRPLKAGDTVLMQGTGGVTLRPPICDCVWSDGPSDEKLKRATKLGAKHVGGNSTLKQSLAGCRQARRIRDVSAPDIIMPCILKGRLVWVCGTVGGNEQAYVCECEDYAARYR
ncbi:hypothetical protein B0H11DRAFT_2195692 [Mycena galericulata]|nr:hypothetical protein B0H11DRAFT_2195692 [Mycena galericulata]